MTILYIALFLGALLGMEGVAYVTHKYVMHGPLWVLHRSHHRPRESAIFEANDLFGFLFAAPSIVLIYFGVRDQPALLALGLGMTAYGFFYFVFHDVIVHRRVSVPYRPASAYMRRLVKAHLVHHKTTVKDGASSFGFLWARRSDAS